MLLKLWNAPSGIINDVKEENTQLEKEVVNLTNNLAKTKESEEKCQGNSSFTFSID